MEQTIENQAQRLVIQNLSVLETAPAVVAEVEERILTRIDERIGDWVTTHENWEGIFGFHKESETSFKPKSWPVNENGDYCAYYTLGSNVEHEEFEYWLSPLVGAVPAQFGIKFEVSPQYVTRLSGKGAKPGAAWRAFLAKEYAERPQLKECHFQLYGEFLFLPIHLDAEVLADAYPHSLADALNPLDTVLDDLAKAHETIDQLLSSALEHTFGKSTG